jgi:hypothetical protein
MSFIRQSIISKVWAAAPAGCPHHTAVVAAAEVDRIPAAAVAAHT